MLLGIYVPMSDTEAGRHIAPRSAIVGNPLDRDPDTVLCHFEGALYGGSVPFFEKLKSAAGRLAWNYPSVAMGAFPVSSLIRVGTYDAERYAVTRIDDPAALEAWSGENATDIAGTRMPPGRVTAAEAAGTVNHPGSRPVGRQYAGMQVAWFKTLAGQVVKFDVSSRTADVFDHDDPALPPELEALGLDEREMALIVGHLGTSPAGSRHS